MAYEIAPELLTEIANRAADYDAKNEFCATDIAALQDAGYLRSIVPAQLGGAGSTLLELSRTQRQLAKAAPATALAANMHQVWAGVARTLWEQGDKSLEWVLRDIAAGEVFAFGISEPGNEAVLLDSRSIAEPDGADGYTVSGTKIFTTLSTAWTRLGVHARCGDKLVFGFLQREKGGQLDGGSLGAGTISHPHVWNPVGMRATHSYTTVLENVAMPAARVAREIAPFDTADALVAAIFTNFSLLTASVYQGLADRAIELAVAALGRKVTLADGTETTAGADEWRAQQFVQATLAHRASANSLDLLCAQADSGELFSRPDIFLALAGAKNQVAASAQQVVEMACVVSGSAAFAADSELSRLRRDVSAVDYHPTNPTQLSNTVRRAYGY